jgi:hypothetical protein
LIAEYAEGSHGDLLSDGGRRPLEDGANAVFPAGRQLVELPREQAANPQLLLRDLFQMPIAET